MTAVVFWIAFFAFFLGILNLLPTLDTTTLFNLQGGVSTLVGQAKAWNDFFPITELLSLVVLIIGIDFVIWLWKAIKWVIHVVRGGSSNG